MGLLKPRKGGITSRHAPAPHTLTVQAFTRSALGQSIAACVAETEQAVEAVRFLAMDLCRAAGGYKDSAAAAGNRAVDTAYAVLDPHIRRWLSNLRPDSDPDEARASWHDQARAHTNRVAADLIDQEGARAQAGRWAEDQYVDGAGAKRSFRRALDRALPRAVGAATSE